MQKTTIKTVCFKIPSSPTLPAKYKDGIVEVGVWPPVGVMPFVLDTERGLERLEEWAVNNVALGFIDGDYTEAELQEEMTCIKILSSKGEILLDTFVLGHDYEPYFPNTP